MCPTRRATVDDVPELVRLRALMHDSMGSPDIEDVLWREAAAGMLVAELPRRPALIAAFVVDGEPGLAACATGSILRKLPSPANPSGKSGYVFNVSTDLDHRRRGHARACMVALLDWFVGEGVFSVELRASVEAEPLYTSLGFVRTSDPSMKLNLKRR